MGVLEKQSWQRKARVGPQRWLRHSLGHGESERLADHEDSGPVSLHPAAPVHSPLPSVDLKPLPVPHWDGERPLHPAGDAVLEEGSRSHISSGGGDLGVAGPA